MSTLVLSYSKSLQNGFMQVSTASRPKVNVDISIALSRNNLESKALRFIRFIQGFTYKGYLPPNKPHSPDAEHHRPLHLPRRDRQAETLS